MPFTNCVERLARVEVEEADQVDEREREREPERDQPPSRGSLGRRASSQRPHARRRPRRAARSMSARLDRAGDLPVHLLEGDREERREEEEARSTRSSLTRATCSQEGRRTPRCASGARAVAATRPRAASRSAARRATSPSSSAERGADPLDVVGCDDDAGPGLADQLGGRAVGRHDREDRPLGGEVLEDLAREHALAAPGRVGDQQQQRLRVALELERLAARRVREQPQPVAESERLGPERGRPSGSRRGSAPRRRARTRRARSGTAAGRACRRSCPVCVIRKRSPRR